LVVELLADCGILVWFLVFSGILVSCFVSCFSSAVLCSSSLTTGAIVFPHHVAGGIKDH